MRIRYMIMATVAASAALALSACSGGGAGAEPASGQARGAQSGGETSAGGSVIIGLTYIPNVQFSPVYVAADQGMYAAQGIEATIRHHGSDEGLFTALTTGQEDVVVASGDEVLQARDQGLDLVSIGAYYQSYPVTIIVPADSPAQSMSDLKGLRVGVPGEYGSSWLGLQAGLAQANMTTSDVEVVSIGYTAQASLVADKVDAVVGFTNNDLVQFEKAGIAVRRIDLAPDTSLVSASMITRSGWLHEDPDRARRVVAATVAGIEAVVDDPEAAISVTQKWDQTLVGDQAVSGARAVLAATIDLFKNADGRVSGVQDLKRWEKMGEFLQTMPGTLSSPPDVSAAVTNEVAGQ